MAIIFSVAVALACVSALSCSCDVAGKERRIYTLASGLSTNKLTYLSDEGLHEGFAKDIVSAVCAEAGMDCRYITVPWGWCWKSEVGQHQRGGVGLMDNWIDACVGHVQTASRVQVLKFSLPFLKTPDDAYFFVKIDSTYAVDDLFDNKKIGFAEGFFSDEQCVARSLGKVIAVKNLVHTPIVALKNALISGQVDAIFIEEAMFAVIDPTVMKKIGPSVHCTLGGNSIMTQKDNDIVDKWNEGFSKLVSSGRYKKMCDEANRKHTKFATDLYCL